MVRLTTRLLAVSAVLAGLWILPACSQSERERPEALTGEYNRSEFNGSPNTAPVLRHDRLDIKGLNGPP